MTTTNYGQQFTESRHTPIDYLTNHPITLPRTTALTRRGQLVRDSPDSLSDETRHLEHVFQKKKTSNPNFIKLNTHRNTEPNETTNNLTPVTTATIPYIKGTSETIAQTSQRHPCSLQTYFTTPTDQRQGQRPTSRQTGSSVQNQMYIGETGRNLNTRLTEYKRVTKNGDTEITFPPTN